MCVSLYLLTPYIWSVQIICKHTYAHNFLCGRKFISSRLRVNFFAGRNLCAPVCNFFASRKPSDCLLEFTSFNTQSVSVPSASCIRFSCVAMPFYPHSVSVLSVFSFLSSLLLFMRRQNPNQHYTVLRLY